MKPPEFENFPTDILNHHLYREALWRFPAVIKNVVDADTVDYMIDKGMHDYPWHRIRHADYDTPEKFRGSPDERKRGKLAEDFLRNEVLEYEIMYKAPYPDMSEVNDGEYGVYGNKWVGLVTLKPSFPPTIDRWAGMVIVMYGGKARLLSDIMKENGHIKREGDTSWGG